MIYIDGQPVQIIHQAYLVNLSVVDLRGLPSGVEEQRLIAEELSQPFDLTQLPLLRWALLRVRDQEHVLIHVEHHLIHDGWSFNVFLQELLELYQAFSIGKPSPLPELPIQFADFAAWQRDWMQGEDARTQLTYWKAKLTGSPPLLNLPTSCTRPAVQSFQGAAPRVELPLHICEALRALSRQEGATLFMTMLAAFLVLLYRYSGQDDICVGTGIANRRWHEAEGLIGMVINTLVLRTDLSGDPPFREFLSRVREVTLEAYTHQDLPFDKVVEALQPERNLSHNPLFQVMFAFHDSPLPDLELPGLAIELTEGLSNGSAKFDLNITVIPRSEQRVGRSSGAGANGITMIWEYSTDLFDAATIKRMLGHYQSLLEGIVAHPEQRLSGLPLLTPQERHQLLVDWNRSCPTLPLTPVHILFEAQTQRTPDAVALLCEDEHLTYHELNQRAHQLAHHLQALGVKAEERVGLYLERSTALVVGLLAILKAGGAYVPLDPAYPAERLAFLLADAGLGVLLTQQSLRATLPAQQTRVICLDSDWPAIAQEPATALQSGVQPQHLAYVIYTSGSTGTPKGVMVSHANLTRLLSVTQPHFHFTAQDRWTLFHSSAFDFSVWELWGALLAGGSLLVVPYWLSRSPEAFYDLLASRQVTVLNQTPSAFRSLTRVAATRAPDSELALRLVIFGGEALESQGVQFWLERQAGPQLVNMYGITETTVHVTSSQLRTADLGAAAGSRIGRPLADLQAYVLDAGMQPVPIGVPGELYIGGAGVARGYLKRPDLTAERFVPDPWGQQPGSRLYKTGDVARFRPDGTLEYLGRNDGQVKIRGFRIEVGEIEAVLSQHPLIREAVVLAREDRPGDKSLVAYVVAHAGNDQAPSSSELHGYLQARLPAYMLPAAFVFLSALPVIPNGKVDRRALPLPDTARPALDTGFVAPRTPEEEILAAIWAQVLGLEQVGVHDNFFELGGDSILSIQVLARAKGRGLSFSLQQLFQYQTIDKLARVLKRTGENVTSPLWAQSFSLISQEDRRKLPNDVEDAYPLTALQAGMLFHSEYSPESTIYHNISSYHLQARFVLKKLQAAVQELVTRHAVLRTSFDLSTFSEPLQLVHRVVPVSVQLEDLHHLGPAEQERELAAWIEAEKGRKFGWTRASLVRFHVHYLSEETFQLTLTEHHAILDGWSVASLLTELFQHYLSLLENDVATSEPPPTALFRDAVALEQEALASEETQHYWGRKLSESSRTGL